MASEVEPQQLSSRLRAGHNPRRSAVSSAEAARRLGLSRYHVAQRVERGLLDGYGIRSEQRTRWFVYEDALERASRPDVPELRLVVPNTRQPPAYQTLSQLNRALLAERQQADRAYEMATSVLEFLSGVVEDDAGNEAVARFVSDLLRAHSARNVNRSAADQALLLLGEQLRAAFEPDEE